MHQVLRNVFMLVSHTDFKVCLYLMILKTCGVTVTRQLMSKMALVFVSSRLSCVLLLTILMLFLIY